jgi:ribosomal protein S12 methylthiotransferase accessory factor
VNKDFEVPLNAGKALIDSDYGIIKDIKIATSPPDEPAMYDSNVIRNHPTQLSDGHEPEPSEGGCSINKQRAVISAIGEAVERYSSCIYRNEALLQDSYDNLERALDPSRIVSFSPSQIETGNVPKPLYAHGDQLRWIQARHGSTDENVYIPAQLVYLNYDRGEEPFLRNPISTGIAAGIKRSNAVTRAALEVIEREAFMIYYLTKTKLQHIDLDEAEGPVSTLIDELNRAGLDWYLLDARTDNEVPVVLAMLIADEVPTVTVAAAAHPNPESAVRDALEEAIQIRLYQRHLIKQGNSPIIFDDVNREEIITDKRLLGWARKGAPEDIDFWIDSTHRISISKIWEETKSVRARPIIDEITKTSDAYIADLTTRDIEEAGFSVVRVVAPEAHPLYLREGTRYWEETRLASVPKKSGYNPKAPEKAPLNDIPHPFA